jgi:hypothetical protein
LLSKNIKIKIYSTIILPVVLCECETWSLTLREERRLRLFENRVLRRIFGPRRDKVTGLGRKQHNEELNDLYCSPNIVRVINIEKNVMGRACRAYGGRGEGLVGKPEGKRPLGRPRHRWEIILIWIFRKWDVGVWTGSSWLRIGTTYTTNLQSNRARSCV